MQPVTSINGAVPRWWDDGAAVRFVADLVAAELARLRPGTALPALPWPRSCDLARDLGVDSLERMALASALSAALQLHRAGAGDALAAGQTIGAWADAASAGLALHSHEITFRTSGSAGQPKPCPHTLASLWAEVGELAALLPGHARILCAVPCHHIYGFLFSILLPRALGLHPDAVRDVRAASPGMLAREARAGDLVVAYPDYWRAALAAGPFAPGVTGVTSTAPCPPGLAQDLEAHGLARLLQVYGSSETGGVGWRDSHAQPFTALPYWRRDPDDAAVLLRSGAGAGSYPLQDVLAWQGERQFLPAGRIDQAVQVGGINVFPERVAQVLRAHPAVAAASVRLMRSDEGSRLKAFVVPHAGAQSPQLLGAELRQWAAARLSGPELPAAIAIGAELPRSASGKLADWIIDAA
ncbi:AMP-binding protein [Massilia soli]|uniref:AMP-binding protein n=1 Tax=Massilia soli TaxID=2792854 RepID=A0ABS7SS63_9BURK|nr:AMP-binding protein [Massilia soli]MBZ2208792.1 AMP-binding protein [Massilia soli]